MLSVFVRAKGRTREGELGKCRGCFRIGGPEFALIERNVPPCFIFIHHPLFFTV